MNLDGWTWEENTLRPSAGLAMTFRVEEAADAAAEAVAAAPAAVARAIRPASSTRSTACSIRRAYEEREPTASVNWTLEPFVPISSAQAMYVNAGTDQAIRDAVAWAEKQGINVVLRISPNSQGMAPFLKAHNVPVILGNVLSMPSNEDRSTPTLTRRGVLAKAGVPFAFSSGG